MRATFTTTLIAGLVAVVAPIHAQAPATPRGDAAITEMNRQRGTDPAVPAVPQQNRASDAADARDSAWVDARQWLMQAHDAVRNGDLGMANELLERAETRMLTRTTLQALATVPMQDARVSHIAAARVAVQRRDAAGAMREIQLALAFG